MRKTLLSAILMMALATMVAGGTFASFSDIDTSYGNYAETGSFDIKVAKSDESWSGSDFRDDQPLGAGLEPVFYIDCAEICETYAAYELLWNSGEYEQPVDALAHLQIRLTEDSADIADTTTLRILYDTNGDDVLEERAFTTLQSLNLSPVTLGLLPADGIRRLMLEIHPKFGPSETVTSFEIAFNIDFWLTQLGDASFSDIESSTAYLKSCIYEGCTPGAWKNRLLRIGEWVPTGYSPDNLVGAVFVVPYSDLASATLLEALSFKGGDTVEEKAEILLRAAVAALLNAAHPDVNYPMSKGDVIAEVNAALASGDPNTMLDLAGILDDYNNLGSPF